MVDLLGRSLSYKCLLSKPLKSPKKLKKKEKKNQPLLWESLIKLSEKPKIKKKNPNLNPP